MNPFWQNIFRRRPDEASLAYFLGTLPIFSKLEKRDLEYLEHIVHLRNYQAEEMVFNQDDIGSGMYIIRSGQVQIFTYDDQGRETEQAVLESGDFFGEIALTATRPRCASARALEPAVLVGLFRSDILDALRRSPGPAARIMLGLNRVISDRLLQCNLQLQELKKQAAARQADDE